MARYRPVFVNLWICDDKFQDYSVEGKLLFLYFITNEHLEESGIYRITYKTIANETDIPRDRVKELIHEELSNNVSYDVDNNVVFVHKFLKFNGSGNPVFLKKSIIKGKVLIKTSLWKEFHKYYTRDLKPINNSSKRVLGNSNSKGNANTKNLKGQSEIDQFEKEFDQFWRAYDYKVKKQRAFKAFKALRRKDVSFEKIMNALRGYADYLHHKDVDENFQQKRMYPSTFLNDENWKDYEGFKYKPQL